MTSPVLKIEGLTKQFGERKAVDDLSFALDRGDFLTIFGPNGAGKTTLLKMISTLARPTSGSITIDGIDALEKPEEIRARIGMISHESMLYPDLSAEENLVLYGRLYGVSDPTARARELLDVVGLKYRRMDRVRTFSRGMAQRVAIARCLMHDPDIVLLDEPYAGLDAHAADVLDALIGSVRENRTFCMVSHDMEKGKMLASHVLIMREGKKVYFGANEDAEDPALVRTYCQAVGKGVI